MFRYIEDLADLRIPFQDLGGLAPSVLLDRHIGGGALALMATDHRSDLERAGVWDASSGKLLWAPHNAIRLAWTERGRQALVLTRTYRPDPNHPTIIVTPLQSEFTHRMERWSWPERAPIDSCDICFPTGWAHEMAASPVGKLATVTWLEQHCGGFLLVRFGNDEPLHQVEWDRLDYQTSSNLIIGPDFSENGRYAVASCTVYNWWVAGGDPETPSPGGRLKAGHIAVLDTRSMVVSEHEVMADVVPGWVPTGFSQELMGSPEFMDARTVCIRLPTGDVWRLSLPQ